MSTEREDGQSENQDQGGETWTPPTREEWEKLNKSHKNKAEEAERLHRKLAAITDQEKQRSEEDAKKKGEFETLYNAAKKEADELKAFKAGVEKSWASELEEMTKDWSDEDKGLLDESLPIQKRLDYARKLSKRFAEASATPKPGAPTGPIGQRGAPNTPVRQMTPEEFDKYTQSLLPKATVNL